MVVEGRAALFYTDARDGLQWHRSEKYPMPCTCGEMPTGPKVRVVKPTLDDSWRLCPAAEVGRCLAAIETAETVDYYGDKIYGVGDRVVLDDKAAELYELGAGRSNGEWWVEAIGKHPDDMTPIARILDKRSGVFAWAPMAWLKKWTPPTPAVASEPTFAIVPDRRDLASGTNPGPTEITITIRPQPSSDPELTCAICGYAAVTHEFTTRAQGRRSVHGIHDTCAKAILP